MQLGRVCPNLRGVGVSLKGKCGHIKFCVDGAIEPLDQSLFNDILKSIQNDFVSEILVNGDLVRVDFPEKCPPAIHYVYGRYEDDLFT